MTPGGDGGGGIATVVETGAIDDIVLAAYRKALGGGVGRSERLAWQNSLTSMYVVVRDDSIPDDAGVSIELQIPQTSKRVDFIIAGQDGQRRDRAVVVELKQWESAEATAMDGVVRTALGGGLRDVSHPSYQAWSYTQYLRDFNEEVQQNRIELHACAYLHNFTGTAIDGPFYEAWLDRAPLFRKGEAHRLREFIKRFVKYGDSNRIAYRIDRGRIRPSKSLADAVTGLMKGNPEFTLLDEQKVVYERALQLVRDTPVGEKRVLIVQGGPGTGKSVVAVNIVARLTRDRELSAYVTRNAAPRAVFESRLTDSMTKSRYSSLFQGSGGFGTADRGTFRALVVDEAHRINEKEEFFGETALGSALDPDVARRLEAIVAGLAERPVLRPADPIHGLIQMLGHVETIDDDLVRAVGQSRDRRSDVGLPHVHDDFFDPLAGFAAEFGPEAVDGRAAAVLADPDDAIPLEIRHDRHVLVSLLKARLVDTYDPQRFFGPPGQPSRERAFEDALGLIPAQPHHPCQARQRRLSKQPDGHRLEQSGEPTPVLRPRHPYLMNAVLRARHPRDPGTQHRPVLARIQMPPPSLGRPVVSRRRLPALRTLQRRVFLQLQTHPDLARLRTHLHRRHPPRLPQAQNRLVQPPIVHLAPLRSREAILPQPTPFPEEPKNVMFTAFVHFALTAEALRPAVA